MKKVLILFLLGGLALACASPVLADLSFSTPRIGRSDNRYIEQGATGTVTVQYTNRTGGAVNIDAAKLYLDYESAIIEQASVRVSNPNGSNFSVNENNTGLAGSIRYQLRTDPAAGQRPLTVANGATVNLAVISFHVNQGAPLAAGYFLRFTTRDRVNNVRVTQSGGDV